MFACNRIDSVFAIYLTRSSALVPVNSGNEDLALRKSSYGISTDRSCVCVCMARVVLRRLYNPCSRYVCRAYRTVSLR